MVMTGELTDEAVERVGRGVLLEGLQESTTVRQTSGFERRTPQGYKHNGLLWFHCNFYCAYFYYLFHHRRVLRIIFGPKRDGVTGEWRKLHNEELNDLYCSPNIVRVINREE